MKGDVYATRLSVGWCGYLSTANFCLFFYHLKKKNILLPDESQIFFFKLIVDLF